MNKLVAALPLASLLLGSTLASAEVSKRDQQKAAQKAYEASSKSHTEAAKGFQKFKDGAEKTKRASDTTLKVLKKLR